MCMPLKMQPWNLSSTTMAFLFHLCAILSQDDHYQSCGDSVAAPPAVCPVDPELVGHINHGVSCHRPDLTHIHLVTQGGVQTNLASAFEVWHWALVVVLVCGQSTVTANVSTVDIHSWMFLFSIWKYIFSNIDSTHIMAVVDCLFLT